MMSRQDIIKRFERMDALVSREEFLDRKLIGGNIPFYIFDYQIEHEDQVNEQVVSLHKRLKSKGVNTVVIDLYGICCEVIEEYSSIEKLKKLEYKLDRSKFLKALQSTLGIEKRVTPLIKSKITTGETKILLIKGVANVYPMLRANELLNHLTDELESISTIVFYPGKYEGRMLTLFDRIPDHKYYRAHPIDELNI